MDLTSYIVPTPLLTGGIGNVTQQLSSEQERKTTIHPELDVQINGGINFLLFVEEMSQGTRKDSRMKIKRVKGGG
ncbi:hypothetical protein J6590_062481 [Homalodisca vitripennis]|nr:hypothetical protein J6590_062481 [Homalodisca vitripennis]